ncbi:MAG: TrmH family RNA methyltransferase [Microcystaceae cyanobacterium]
MITSLQNPLVKQIRKLHHRKGRRSQHRFLLEGTHLIETAIEGQCSLETVCYTDDWQQRYHNLWEILQSQAQRLELVSPEVLKSLATTVNPDGIIGTVSRFNPITPSIDGLKLGLVIDNLQDPGNLGTIIRTSAATGVESLWLSANSVEIDHPKVLRASAGAWFKIPCQTSDNLGEVIKTAQKEGIQVIATLPDAETIYWELDLTQPTLILLGNEGAGLPQNLVELADQPVTIPQCEGVESLNVAIAASVILYEVTRQRALKT